MTMIKLTDWESGLPVYLDPTHIKQIRQLPAKICNPLDEDDPPQELGGRTRIDTLSDLLLVRETAEEIVAMINASNGGPTD